MANTITRVSKVSLKDSYVDEYYSPAPWTLYTIDEVKVYEADSDYQRTWLIDLADRDILYVYPGTKLILIIDFGHDIYTSDTLIEYAPDSNLTAYFEFVGKTEATYLKYLGSW